MTKSEEIESLAQLRDEIDRIDRDLHAGLIARGEIIDRLIAVKSRMPGTSAFRPAREADMMRRLVTRHRGILPLATVESIWRVIIATFTYVQAPYSVHADIAAGDAPMRDSARFHFGFTVPLCMHEDAAHVVAAVARSVGDLGLLRADHADDAWWKALAPEDAPKIIARLPFVERADHVAGLPIFIVAKPLREGAPEDVLLYAVRSRGPLGDLPFGIVARHGDEMIVATDGTWSAGDVAEAVGSKVEVAWIGSHAARFEFKPG